MVTHAHAQQPDGEAEEEGSAHGERLQRRRREERWGDELTELDLAVDMVPEIEQTDPDATTWPPEVVEDLGVPLAQLVPAGVDRRGLPSRARIVLYSRPLEARSRDGIDLVDLLHEVLIEQVACYLGVEHDALEAGG